MSDPNVRLNPVTQLYEYHDPSLGRVTKVYDQTTQQWVAYAPPAAAPPAGTPTMDGPMWAGVDHDQLQRDRQKMEEKTFGDQPPRIDIEDGMWVYLQPRPRPQHPQDATVLYFPVKWHWQITEQGYPVHCPKKYGHPCPVCEHVEAVIEAGMKDKADPFKQKEAFIWGAIPCARSGVMDFQAGIKVLVAPSTLHSKLLNILGTVNGITEPPTARPIVIMKSGSGRNTKYDANYGPNPAPWPPGSEVLYPQLYDLRKYEEQLSYGDIMDILKEGVNTGRVPALGRQQFAQSTFPTSAGPTFVGDGAYAGTPVGTPNYGAQAPAAAPQATYPAAPPTAAPTAPVPAAPGVGMAAPLSAVAPTAAPTAPRAPSAAQSLQQQVGELPLPPGEDEPF